MNTAHFYQELDEGSSPSAATLLAVHLRGSALVQLGSAPPLIVVSIVAAAAATAESNTNTDEEGAGLVPTPAPGAAAATAATLASSLAAGAPPAASPAAPTPLAAPTPPDAAPTERYNAMLLASSKAYGDAQHQKQMQELEATAKRKRDEAARAHNAFY
jgi:hypothetical protein